MEHDTMGEVAVPADRHWGAQTQRSLENFPIGEEKMPPDLIRAFALLKLACRRGMELNLPRVVEIPDGIWEDVPLDGENWKLPGQAVLDRALGPDGDKLLATLKLRERFQNRG